MYEIDWDAFLALPEHEQKEMAKELEQLAQLSELNPLLFFYPHGKQASFLAARNRFKWFLGGNRSGKTTCCTIDDLIQAVDEEALPEHLKQYKKWQPPFYWRVLGPDFQHIDTVVIPAMQEWIPRTQLEGQSWDKAYDKSHGILRLKNGSMCQFKTYGQEAWQHGGAKFHRTRYDEEPPRDIYSENTYRLIDYGGDCLIAMTPVQGLTWMYDEFWMPYERGELKDAHVQLVDMDDNPHLDEAAKHDALATSTSEEREARKTGKFVHFHGLVYAGFEECLIPQPSSIPEGVPVYVGIDPGIRHMAAVVFVYQEEDTLVLFHELALQGMTAYQVCQEIKKVETQYEIRPQWYVIDPSARNKSHSTGRSLQLEYADGGISTFAGQNDLRAGINNVKVRLEHRKLLIHRHCKVTIEQFRKYRWVQPYRNTTNDPREVPIKRDDHLLDALRYLCMARPYGVKRQSEEDKFVHPLELAVREEMSGRRERELPAHAY